MSKPVETARGDAIDVSSLPRFAFGSRGIMWWGILGFLAIETTMLAICLVAYFSFRSNSIEWPPPPIPPPPLDVGTVTLVLLLASVWPMRMADKAAKRLDVPGLIRWHVVCDVTGVAIIVSRCFELWRLPVRWDTNAYGSIVWMILGLHTAHLFAEVVETIVITLFFWIGHTEPKMLVDSTDNALYWFFIVAIWVPCFVTLYLVPRFG